jgi:hypothetical protein
VPNNKPLTQAQLDALAKGRARREETLKAAEGKPKDETRWRKLLDGTITVRDLDDEEIKRQRVRINGQFNGRARTLPSHLRSAMIQEAIRRAKDTITASTQEVTKELLDIARDDDVPVAQRIKVLMYLQDRQLGKAPETIRVEGGSAFDQVTMEALGLDRDLADDA